MRLWNIAKIAPGGKFIALNAHMREEDKQKSNEHASMSRVTEEQLEAKGGRRKEINEGKK